MDPVIYRIIVRSCFVLVICFIAGVVLNIKEIYFGFTLGGAIAIMNFIFIINDSEVVAQAGYRAKKVAQFKFFKRYMIVFIIVTIAVFLFRFNNFIGLLAGLILIKFIIAIDGIFKGKK